MNDKLTDNPLEYKLQGPRWWEQFLLAFINLATWHPKPKTRIRGNKNNNINIQADGDLFIDDDFIDRKKIHAEAVNMVKGNRKKQTYEKTTETLRKSIKSQRRRQLQKINKSLRNKTGDSVDNIFRGHDSSRIESSTTISVDVRGTDVEVQTTNKPKGPKGRIFRG